MANLYHIINPANETWMCVNENFTTKRKYALMFTKRGAEKMVEKYPNLTMKKTTYVCKKSEMEVYRLKDIPSEFLVKKERKPRSSKFTYQPGELKIVKKEERETERDNKKVNEDYLFAKLNVKCLGCSKVCKQSAKAVILACPDYKKI